ncbi:MAG: T9SS type A sorting domain-containing protein [Saprospiraceae bacterium]
MKILLTTFALAISPIGAITAQNINFEVADPHPLIQQADVGDMEFADIDNDGDNDLIMIGKGGPIATTIYVNDGDGGFTESANTALENVFNGTIAVIDIDGDDDLDLLIAATLRSVASTILYVNDGFGIFSPSPIDIPNYRSTDIAFGDVDNDNDQDIIISGTIDVNGTVNTKLFLSDGNGGFAESTTSTFSDLTSRLELFDCDGDNDLDLIVSGYDSTFDEENTILYLNDGQGGFSEQASASFNDLAGGDVTSGDIDNDGDLDVLICGQGANGTATELYLNDGAGDFTMVQDSLFADVTFGDVSMSDLDNDGDLDVFVLGTGPGGLANNLIVGSVYENQGSVTFVKTDSLAGAYLASHAVGDIDGDRDLDLVLGGTTIGERANRDSYLYFNETPLVVSNQTTVEFDQLTVYPNPFQDIITLEFEVETKASIQIYSTVGALVYATTVAAKTSQLALDLPTGNYLLKVVTENGNYEQQISSVR